MEQYDLLIVADATASMGDFLTSLNTSLPRIISVSELTGCFSRIGLLAYRDYSDDNLLEWSGWLNQSLDDGDANQADPVALARSLEPDGGGDYPEAAKTALAKAYEVMRPEATTVILLYADAPPHQHSQKGFGLRNGDLEVKALSDAASYGGWGPKFVDWVSGCDQLRNGDKKAQVFAMLDKQLPYFNFLCTMTRGACVNLKSSKPSNISAVTMELLLTWMGVERVEQPGKRNDSLLADLSRYVYVKGIKKLKSENDNEGISFFRISSPDNRAVQGLLGVEANITKTRMTLDSLQRHLPKKTTPATDFADSWSKSAEYQALAVKSLKKLIDSDVMAITLNPVFGRLWRTVCSDRKNEARAELVAAFSLEVERTTDPEDKVHLKAWLEESYDYTAEVLSTIENVPEKDRFPCVFLDPTLTFTRETDLNDDQDDTNRPLTALIRAELLEIGRSCDAQILRRLGRILTQLTYVKTAADMPEHIAATSNEEVPRIPTVLAEQDYGCCFWNVLLHVVVPGTMLSARPAALLAALSLRLGMAPLAQAADREMFRFRNKWNDIEVPENWTVSCLSLLLDADDAYRQRVGQAKDVLNGEAPKKPNTLLKESDRTLFENLVVYRMLELNLDSTLTARVGWTPEKAVAPIGPLVVCRICQYPRSVTIMGANKKCGVCLSTDPKELEKRVSIGVSKDATESTPATWVECCVRTCRAQYVVYDAQGLEVRAKCHYCRSDGRQPQPTKNKAAGAPWVECKNCLSRVIWPELYRAAAFAESGFVCPPCNSGVQTMVDIETTANKLSGENTLSWLILDIKNRDASPFTHRSLYNTISTIGTEHFLSRIKLLPSTDTFLTMKGKIIRNFSSLVSTIQGLVFRRQTEKVPCCLCFSDFRPKALKPACGRQGCVQHICAGCLSGWYGLNSVGRIINTAALSCPFCRRLPSNRTLAKYGRGILAVRNLANAVRNNGTWIYAWCGSCASAKQYMERVCARGIPSDLKDWECDECREETERERVEQESADEQLARVVQGTEDTSKVQQSVRKTLRAMRFKRLKPCPKCGVMTEKDGGCDHVVCPVRECLAHWCYECGNEFEEGVYHGHSRRGVFYEDDDDDYY